MTYFFLKIATFMWDQRTALLGIMAFCLWITEMAQKVVVTGFVSIFNMISSIDLSQLQKANFSSLEFIGVGNAIFPFSEMLAMLVVYYTLWINLIILRWIKSFIPTVAN